MLQRIEDFRSMVLDIEIEHAGNKHRQQYIFYCLLYPFLHKITSHA